MYIGIGYILPTVWGKYISWMYVLVLDILITSYREIFERRKKIVASDTKGGGKGVRAEKKTQTDFKKCFFLLQKPYKIIIGPPKHVLDCFGPMGISTAIKTASIVALYDFFDDPLAPLNGQLMGPRASCQMPQNLLYFF